MQAVFLAVALLGSLYFLLAKRRFDFLSVAFFSACVYFMPGFFGYANTYLGVGLEREVAQVELVPETYLVFVLVLGAILSAAVLLDFLKEGPPLTVRLRGGGTAAVWATALGLAGFVASFATMGDVLLYSEKVDVLDGLDRWHLLWSIGASLGVVLAFGQRRWLLLAVCTFLLLVDVYVGFRVSFATTAVAVFALWLSEGGRQRFALRNWKIALAGGGLAFFVFVYKQLYVTIKLGMWDSISDRTSDAGFYSTVVTQSEPFTTQAILNGVLANDFRVGLGHLAGFVNLVVPFSQGVFGPATSFNTLFQPALFPETQGGMANNIWAEMWSSGGWPLLALFVLVFVLALALGSYLLQARDPVLAGGAALFFAYWAFYIHRNDLLFQLTLERRVFFFWVFCALLSMVLYEVGRYLGRAREPGSRRPERAPDAVLD